jgi:hypothetical protein
MKTLNILTGAIAVAVAFATANQANCQSTTSPQVTSPLILTVSGTVEYQKAAGPDEGSIATYSFNEKTVYLLVSNYVANAQYYSYTNIAGTNLPADGYIAFNPNHDLFFYVTNKAGFYYPLSGFDANGQYFSWIELDSFVFYGYDSGYLQFGTAFESQYQLFNTVADYKFDLKGGKTTSFSTGVLYIHDDPYNYDDADNPHVYWENFSPWEGGAFGGSDDQLGHNNSMIEIRGALTSRLNFIAVEGTLFINSANLSLNGAGNFYEHDIYDLDGVLISGQASLVP